MKEIAPLEIVAFEDFGAFRIVAPGLAEIVGTAELEMVAGGNVGCTKVGPRNTQCFNDFCHNGVCVNVAC